MTPNQGDITYQFTGYEVDSKFTVPKNSNYFMKRIRGKKLLSRGTINLLSSKKSLHMNTGIYYTEENSICQ